jgi:hypothetical protein
MCRVEQVIRDFLSLDNGSFGIGQFHLFALSSTSLISFGVRP